MRHRRSRASLAAALLAAAPAVQAQDARIVAQPYKEAEVVRLDGKLGVQATIGFGEGEQIENVAVGDADKWQITPNKRADLLFVKPLDPAARTNMTVVTDKRTYFFDLVASPTAKPVYMLRFTYGEQAAPAAVPVASVPVATVPAASVPAVRPAEVAQPSPAAASATPAAPAPTATLAGDGVNDPAMLNFSWRKKGAKSLAPLRIYDDGSATYLLWGDEQDIPQILLRGADGTEKPADFAIRGNTIVIASVPELIVLRGGRVSATLENMRGKEPPSGEAGAAPATVAVSSTATPAN